MRLLLCRSLCSISRPHIRHYSQSPVLSEEATRTHKNVRLVGDRDGAKRRVVFSGIQPTGVPHLGNYLGALREWKDLQEDARRQKKHGYANRPHLYFSVVDLHALTGQSNREARLELRRDTFASLLAIGIDPTISNIFYQSSVPAHSELMWILSTLASTGYLSRMTQWKSKLELPEDTTLNSNAATEQLKLGLFSYPVLQAADILVHGATAVPVGEDQSQHLEFARSLARSFNAHYAGYKSVLKEPEALISPAKRIMSLTNPSAKMSKSQGDIKSRILITDNEDEIQAKFKNALTDSEDGISYDVIQRPGISNLLSILKHVTRSHESCEEIAREHASMTKGAFKSLVAAEVIRSFAGFRDKFEEVRKPGNRLFDEALRGGLRRAKGNAGQVLSKVHYEVGLISEIGSSVRRLNSGGLE